MSYLRAVIIAGLVLGAAVSPALGNVILRPPVPGFYQLEHQKYYVWWVQWSPQSGEVIRGVTLTFEDLVERSNDYDNRIYLHLLNNEPDGSPELGIFTFVEQDGAYKDAFEAMRPAPPLIGVYQHPGYGPETIRFDLGRLEFTGDFEGHDTNLLDELTAYAADDGYFGIGIDPDCVFVGSGFPLAIETSSMIPAPGAMVLVLVGVGMLGWAKRRSSRW